ncbi:MAG: prolyl oligopeptidase family serine peptidase [Planctomycetes bacterium]|nr:prolyl oligopeptidase family serine peptidase [Planctomycetota bacterium]
MFGFHGHGGSMQNAARSFKIHELWPEAVVVYLQGLPTPGRLTDPEGKKAGWQAAPGEQEDRDLKLFDAVLAWSKEKHKIDEHRVYCTGHSNGGGFTYLLWASRPGVFAAIAPSAAAGARNLKDTNPCPVFHAAGQKDPLVKFEIQQLALTLVRAFNGCEEKGTEWDKGCTQYASSKESPVVTFIHDGGHQYPAEAPALIVKFFKEHSRQP